MIDIVMEAQPAIELSYLFRSHEVIVESFFFYLLFASKNQWGQGV